MTIAEIMNLCTEASLCKVEIYSLEKDKTIWSGVGDEIPYEYEDLEIASFDVPSNEKMTFNVE